MYYKDYIRLHPPVDDDQSVPMGDIMDYLVPGYSEGADALKDAAAEMKRVAEAQAKAELEKQKRDIEKRVRKAAGDAAKEKATVGAKNATVGVLMLAGLGVGAYLLLKR